MSNVTRICLCVVASSVLAATCVAQARGTRPAKRERAPKRVPPMGVAVPAENPPAETRVVGQAIVTYHPSSNATAVLVTLQGVYRRGQVSTDLVFGTGFEGREFVRQGAEPGQSKGELRWVFRSQWDIFKRGLPLIVTVDGERYSFEAWRDDSYIPGMHAGSMDFASFERIANSKSARWSVGRVAFDLTEAQREAMRDLLRIFETPEKR